MTGAQFKIRHLRNGRMSTSISLLDRGMSYGDGLFETILIHNNQCVLWDEHLERLQEGGIRLKIPCPSPLLFKKEAECLIDKTPEGILKIILTRGEGDRGYAIPVVQKPTRILSLFPPPDYPPQNSQEGIRVIVLQTRLAKNSKLAGIKHLNRLEQILGRSEWQDLNSAEGLMLDTDNHVIEGTMSNVFVEKNGVFHTPALQDCGVAGVMRRFLLDFFEKEHWPYEIRSITLPEIFEADSLFFTNSLFGIWPVRELENQVFRISPQVREFQKCFP